MAVLPTSSLRIYSSPPPRPDFSLWDKISKVALPLIAVAGGICCIAVGASFSWAVAPVLILGGLIELLLALSQIHTDKKKDLMMYALGLAVLSLTGAIGFFVSACFGVTLLKVGAMASLFAATTRPVILHKALQMEDSSRTDGPTSETWSLGGTDTQSRSLPEKKPQAGPAARELPRQQSSVAPTPGLIGFTNFRNSCFMNATLKACLALEVYRNKWSAFVGGGKHSKMRTALRQVVADFTKGVPARTLWDFHRNFHDFNDRTRQYDAQEFFLALMDRTGLSGSLDKRSQADPKVSADSEVSFEYRGRIVEYRGRVPNRMPMLQVEYTEGNPPPTVQQLVEHHLAEEITAELSQYDAEGLELKDAPKEITRFKHTLEHSDRSKLKSFAVQVKLFRYEGTESKKISAVVSQPLTDIQVTISGEPVHLRLKSMVCHIGTSVNNGHYVAYTERDGQWYCHNDSSVSVATVQGQTIKGLKGTPYLFFYEPVPAASAASAAAAAASVSTA